MLLGVCCMLALANAIKTANSQEGSLERVELAQETVMAQLDANAETQSHVTIEPCLNPNGTPMVCSYGWILDLELCVCCKKGLNGKFFCNISRNPTNPVEMIAITDPNNDPDAGRKRRPKKLASNGVEMIAITDPNFDEDLYRPRPKKLAYSCDSKDCVHPLYFNEAKCECLCLDSITCKFPLSLDPIDCNCKCETKLECPDAQIWDEKLCTCACEVNKLCPSGYTWSDKYCSCLCAPEECGKNFLWDQELCKCV